LQHFSITEAVFRFE